ncbi:DUF995 domain-containing protein [Rhizobium sp. P40RR-XXII]|uniref:DUF995 domain-containing protein n=1 Tax=Rhizobium sp. P40RR-XXII TaxID=2726739 RepID=UPI0014574879|nr:DUF995 domain-containing protein [Rhizobium sp. P40RR-XXII]NLS17736.1 DUF995 domain-containing protein [Rhizobium sp. P40RR-XXII]
MSLLRLSISSAAISLLLLGGPAHAASPQHADWMIERSAIQATSISASDVRSLYSGRSWIWKDGAGYFSAKQGTFMAWSHNGAERTYAKGTWYATFNGKLCMKARWQSKKYDVEKTSCFLHREKDGAIYQKRLPDGKWYVFRHNPLRHDDEAMKLRGSNYVIRHLPS